MKEYLNAVLINKSAATYGEQPVYRMVFQTPKGILCIVKFQESCRLEVDRYAMGTPAAKERTAHPDTEEYTKGGSGEF